MEKIDAFISNKEKGREQIETVFKETPSEHIELLANHLARPDGFIKTLMLGCLASSKELTIKISPQFVKTHRGFYWTNNPQHGADANEYISFNVGKAQRMYAVSSTKQEYSRPYEGGLGFSFPAEKLLKKEEVIPTWGMFHIEDSLEKIKNTHLFEKRFEKFLALDTKTIREWDLHPPKEHFLDLVHLSRKAGELEGGDQAEIGVYPVKGALPRLALREGIILLSPKIKKALLNGFFSKNKKRRGNFQKI